MKCEHCPFIIDCGTYEYFELECEFFYDETPEPFCEEDGCNLKYKEAKKLHKLSEKLESFRYGCDVYFNHFGEDNPKYTEEELKEIEEYRREAKKANDEYKKYLEILKERRKK